MTLHKTKLTNCHKEGEAGEKDMSAFELIHLCSLLNILVIFSFYKEDTFEFTLRIFASIAIILHYFCNKNQGNLSKHQLERLKA